MASHYEELALRTGDGMGVVDITERVQACVARSGVAEGAAVVSGLHTTVALVVNEHEARLMDDLRTHFLRLVPPDAPYAHNDIHLRDCPPDEPENAHAHLIAMMLGSSRTLAVHGGRLVLGRWQSLLLVELDGPRDRRVAVQVWGEAGACNDAARLD